MGHLKPNIHNTFSASIRSSLSSTPKVAESLLDAYGFTTAASSQDYDDDDSAFLKFLHFANDIGYYAPTVSFARGWPKPTASSSSSASTSSSSSSSIYTFFFNEPNPWPGPFQGQASHVLDVVFLFQNFNDHLPPAQRAAAEGFALDLMRFVAGQEPWAPYKKAKVFGPSPTTTEQTDSKQAVAKVIADAESPETGRRMAILELGKEVGFDKLVEAFGRFQIGL